MNSSKKIIYLFLYLLVILTITDLSFAQAKIAILYSEMSEKYATNDTKNVLEEITAWELFLMQNNFGYRVIYDSDIDSGLEGDFDILILPGVEYISTTQFDVLKEFLNADGSIISSGSKLLFVENGVNDDSNIRLLLGLNKVESISFDHQSFYHSIISNHLNHFDVNDDIVIQLSKKSLFCEENQNEYHASGFLISPLELNQTKTAIVYGRKSLGKFVWTGFGMNDVIGGSTDFKQYQNYLLDVIKWMDVESDVYLNLNFTNKLKPAVLTVELNNALEPELIDVLVQNNFSPNLIVNPKQEISKEIIKKFKDEAIILDLTLLQEADSDSKSLSKIINIFNQEFEVSVSNIILESTVAKKMDYELLNDCGIKNVFINSTELEISNKFINNIYVTGFNRNKFYSGKNNIISFVCLKPQINCDNNFEDELFAKLSSIKPEELKFSSINDVSNWIKLKSNVSVKITNNSENKMDIMVTNNNNVDVTNFDIYFKTNFATMSESLKILLNNKQVEYYFKPNIGLFKIELNQIEANSNLKISISIYDE